MLQFSSPAVIAAVAAFVPAALAMNGPIIPCAKGAGDVNGCGSCKNASAIVPTPWNHAKRVPHLNIPGTATQGGPGWDVYWSVPHVDPGCKVLLTQPFLQSKHNPELSGNVILSTAHPGCFSAHVSSAGVSAAYCCGDGDCKTAGATEFSANSKRSTVYRRSSSVERRRKFAESLPDKPQPVKRTPTCWGGTNCAEPSGSPKPLITCTTATPVGDTYQKADAQQVDGSTLNCNGGSTCSLMPAMSVSVSDTVTNEHSTELTQSNGVSVSATAGYSWGLTATVTAGYNHDWSKAVTDSTSTSNDKTTQKTLTLNVNLMGGSTYNLWFTPTLNCQQMNMTCNDVPMTVEKCTPSIGGDGNPNGEHGVMSVG